MKNKISMLMMLLFFLVQTGKAQQEVPKSFSLKEAVDYAKKNNYTLQNSRLDKASAIQKVHEVRATGLPQINGSANLIDNLTIASNVINFGGQQTIIKFGTPYTSTFAVNANQILFDGTFLVGLRASKEFINMTTLNINRSEIETEITISKQYYLCLLLESQETMLTKNVESLQKNKEDLDEILKKGMIEKVEVDRIKLQLSNLTLQRDKIHDAQLLNLMLLKFQMGLKADAQLGLTDKLENLFNDLKDQAPVEKAEYASRVEYKILQQTLRLNNLDKKRYNMGYLPSVNAFFTHQQISFGAKNISDLYQKFYPGTSIGVSVSLPIFDGLRKSAQAQQADISIKKTENDIKLFENVIDQQLFLARTNFIRTRTQVDNQKQNMELAQDIYNKTLLKFSSGLATSTELTTSQTDLNNSITNYLSTLLDYFVAEIELKRSVGGIK